jgi:hypothetical protein
MRKDRQVCCAKRQCLAGAASRGLTAAARYLNAPRDTELLPRLRQDIVDAHDGGPVRLIVDLNNMHLLNEVTGAVI